MALPRPFLIRLVAGALALAASTLAGPCFAGDDASDDTSDGSSADGDKSGSDPAKPKSDDKDKEDKPSAKDTSFGHMGQVGLRAGLVGGFRMILRYATSPYCRVPDLQKPADKQVKFCGHPAPFDADFGLSFGVLDFFEPFAWARLGLSAEGETDTKPLVVIGAGARIYTMSDNAFKIFIEPAVGWELEGGRGNALWQLNGGQYKKDFLFHIAAGPQFDFSPYAGAYLTGGLTAGFVRDLGASLDVNLGVQGRYP